MLKLAGGKAFNREKALDCMLDGVSWPAYVKTARWDVVAWNRAATMLFGDYAAICPEQRNVLGRTSAPQTLR